jgi:hypothetical protein
VKDRASRVIVSVARLLNDYEPGYEHIRWTRLDLLDYLNDAQAQLYVLRPAAFTRSEAFVLRPGSLQGPLQDGCQLQRVVGSGDGSRARKVDDVLLQAFAGFGCKPAPASAIYRVSGFSFNPEDAAHFFVDPPVPEDGAVHAVTVICQQVPRILTLAELDAALPSPPAPPADQLDAPGALRNSLIEWMLYRAYSVDMESPQSSAKQNLHLQTFNALLGIAERKATVVAASQSGRQPQGARP